MLPTCGRSSDGGHARKWSHYSRTFATGGTTMGFTVWYLVRQADHSFRFVANTRYGDFHSGRSTLPEARPGEVLTVEVVLHLEQRAPGEVIHVEHRRFPVLASGRRDPASIEWEWALMCDVVGSTSSARPESARRRWATRQLSAAFQWTPTAVEARAIADAVSRRAKQPLLGGRPLRVVDGTASPHPGGSARVHRRSPSSGKTHIAGPQ